ncbi:MAG: DUF2849 domain-containing protein [Rhizobiales bacterium]|nr:DUF2849 domain-containing protein [Hyphomicrobiales bacterium]
MSQPVKAPKVFKPVVVTANELASGAVVFRHADGLWSIDVGKAEIAESREAGDALLALALADQEGCLVVDPALIEIVREGGFVRPASLRELIRASGPTVALPADAYAHL